MFKIPFFKHALVVAVLAIGYIALQIKLQSFFPEQEAAAATAITDPFAGLPKPAAPKPRPTVVQQPARQSVPRNSTIQIARTTAAPPSTIYAPRTSYSGSALGPGARVLLIGDSLSGEYALNAALGNAIRRNGAAFECLAEDGRTITDFAQGRKTAALDQTLSRFAPNIVIVSLGTNDDYNKTVSNAHVINSVRILEQKFQSIGAKYVWIGPPSLGTYCYLNKRGERVCNEPTNRISSALEQHLAGKFFDSRPLQMKRYDGLHPEGKAYSQIWAPAFMNWLSTSRALT